MLEKSFYADKVRGCWVGKSLAGAIGMPFEGVPFSLDLSAEQVVVRNVPNDDLELQLVWMHALKIHGTELTALKLADWWKNIIKSGPDEYDIATHNIAHGVMPPASGWKNNFFHDGLGATIRSEIWALVFPERPDAAAYFAQQDAEVDHWGDGVRGEIFMAQAEAHAFVHSDVEAALRYALAQLPEDTRIFRALAKVFAMYDAGTSAAEARDFLLLTEQRNSNFTDCVMNLSFMVYALLYGHGDFLKTALMAVNFGRDTDCTGASCGAFLGIAHGTKTFQSLPEEWLNAVSDGLIVSDYIKATPDIPETVNELIAQTIELHEALQKQLSGKPYPAYTPYVQEENLPSPDYSEWLVLKKDEYDMAALEEILRQTGECPPELKAKIVSFDTPFMDLSPFVENDDCLHLFSFLTVNNQDTNPEDILISATADVGHRFRVNGRIIMNCHNRQKMLPSFHRAEGGAAFNLPLKAGETYLFHWQFFHCQPPMKACMMFGRTFNRLDGFDFRIS